MKNLMLPAAHSRDGLMRLILAAALAVAGAACGTESTPDSGTTAVEDTDEGTDQEIAQSDIPADEAVGQDAADVPATGCTQDSDCEGKIASLDPKLCQKAVCNAGKCAVGAADAGTSCDDKQACTTGDKCSGAAAGLNACGGTLDCPTPDGKVAACVISKCADDGSGTCQYANQLGGTPCDDGDPCTVSDSCQAGGVCAKGAPKPCTDDGNPCTLETCDPAGGECKTSLKTAGVTCDDGNACTGEDKCDATGKCEGVQVTCSDDGNPCTAEYCDSVKGCSTKAQNDGSDCDDNDACTTADKCASKVCTGKPDVGIDDGNPCTKDLADGKGISKCKVTHEPQDGVPCDDGEPCTKGDSCTTGACKGTDLVCNDGNPCTNDQCDPTKCASGTDKTTCGQCVSPAMKDGSSCDDNNKCTSKDVCTTGKCVGLDLLLTGGCDDKNPCTSDGCQPGAGCINVPNPAAVCSDGDPCTEIDKCQGATCKGIARDCKDNDPCTADSCDSKIADITKACVHTIYEGPCDDGNACKLDDVCTGGVCSGVKALNCDDGNPCTIDTCESGTGCKNKPAPGGFACDDGLSCTVGDYCDSGKCVAQKDTCVSCSSDLSCKSLDDSDLCNGVVKCIDSVKGKVCAVDLKTVVKCATNSDTPCSTNTCNPDTGVCSALNQPEGAPCKGDDKCQTATTCSALGQCLGKTISCDDKNDCTTEVCDPAAGCKFTTKADNVPCDDGTLCTPTEGDKCKGGQCLNPVNTCACLTANDCKQYEGKDGDLCNEKYDCLASPSGKFCKLITGSDTVCDTSKDTPCVVSTCEKLTGQCKPVTKSESALCDDGSVCTVGDFCKSGICTKAKDLNCDDNNPCSYDVCDPFFGCDHAPKTGAGACDDGDKCTTEDKCVKDAAGNAVCQGIKATCDDGNPCTVDSCSKTSGCANQIDNTLGCDDGDPCTGKDMCKDGVCAGPALNCDDKNSCTIDVCDGAGGCKNLVIDGKDCSDGNACTVQDTCKSNQCIGVPKICDDGNQCTEDSCQNGSCVILALQGATCNDGNACTKDDLCDNKGGCTGKAYTCDTSNVCIAFPQGCLATKGCIGVNNDGIPCNDGDACTAWSGALPNPDHCLGGACTGLPITCDDKNICTNDVCDKTKGCLITQNTCDDSNPCTTDICEKAQGCQHTVLDGPVCDDGDACTDNTKCNAGKCQGSPISCDDKNGCTVDSCDITKGCVFLPGADTAVTCDDNNPCTDDACAAGACVGSAKLCDDGNPCTQDSCDKLKGCVTVDLKDGDVCDDGDACTDKTKCTSGQCSAGVVSEGCYACKIDSDCDIYDNNNKCDGAYSCKQSSVSGLKLCYFNPEPVFCDTLNDGPCKKNTCQSQTGKCAMSDLLNGSKCEDGMGCTAGDFCLNGACKAGSPTDCSKSGDQCNDATCTETGKFGEYTCVAMPKAGTPSCDGDGDGCTFNDVCIAGKCQVGTKVDCSGVAKDCETASCKSTGANAFQCVTAPSKDGDPCNDKQLCTDGDFCKAGKCQPGTGIHDCSSLSATCADGLCDKTGNGGLGACVPKPKNEGAACDSDSNGCTTGDKCVAGACVAGVPPDCTGKTTNCAVGACSSSSATTFTCIGAPKKDTLPCDADNNGCTLADACKAGKCLPGAPMDCAAKNSKDGCQVGVCKSPPGLAAFCDVGYAPKDQVCDSDQNGCTQGDACNGQGSCQPGKAVDCLGTTTGCAQGVCQSTGPATYTCKGDPKPDGSKCDADINGCTVNDKCAAGKCVAGTAVDCGAELNVKPTACTAPKCISSGSETHQCDNAALKDGLTCDADGKGCTPGDECQLGFCVAGDFMTCSSLAGLCADVSCQDLSPTSYKCLATPKESYPPLDPPVECTPTVTTAQCAAGYNCVVMSKEADTGLCMPKVTVNCDDGNLCTEADVCSGGKCTGGTAKDCDDKDPCTLDSCSAGQCVNKPIAGCQACLDEKFDQAVALGWSVTHTDVNEGAPPFVLWKISDKKPYAGVSNMRAEWKGPGPEGAPANLKTTLLSRRFYTQDSIGATLEFYLSMSVLTEDCGVDDIEVRINGIKVWERCTTTKQPEFALNSNYVKVSLDVSKYSGAPMDVDFVVLAGTTGGAGGTIDIDSVRLTGACGPACMGTGFEPMTEDESQPQADLVMAAVPQPWRMTSSDAGYVGFGPVAAAGHTGVGFLQAKYSGKPGSGKQETAKLLIPKVQVSAGDAAKLWFALRAPTVGDETCGNDDFIVKVGGKEVFKRCNSLANWQAFSVDLPVGVTSDVEFSVVTGLGSTSAGTFELDDIAVAGKCMWACFYDGFDNGGFVANWLAEASQPAVWKPWAISVAQSKTPTGSAFNGYSGANQPKNLTLSTLSAKIAVHRPVLGAVWSYYVNATVQSPNCPTAAHKFRYLMSPKLPGSFEAVTYDLDGNETLDATCTSTSGWTQRIGELPESAWGLTGKPAFVNFALSGNKTLQVYVDEVLMMCR